MSGTLRAGAARVELPCEVGAPMMGYGARAGPASAHHDSLYARALYLESGAGRALLLECDLCLMGVEQARALRARVAERTGLSPSEILVGCIHTHSGPETGLVSIVSRRPLPSFVPPLWDAAEDAAVRAHAESAPARLGAGRTEAHIGRNRRAREGPLDPEVAVLRVDRASGEPLAVLYVHGCHPTALGHDNLIFSADWPGAAARYIEHELPGAIAIFALGAHADVDPRTRGLLDLAIPDQSIGVGFDEAAALGEEVGSAVAACARGIQTAPDAEVSAAVRDVELRVQGGSDAAGSERHRAAAIEALDLAPESETGPKLRTIDFYRYEHENTRAYPLAERRARIACVRRYMRDRDAQLLCGGAEARVEVQLLRLGPLVLLGIPLEATVDVGLDWRTRAGGLARVVSIANGWLRYLPHARNFDEPGAEQMYEILNATFEPEAAERLLDAGEALLRETANLDPDPARG